MNGFLLDTHIWLWHLGGSPDLPAGLRRELEHGTGQLWLSPVSIWEVGLLQRRGRLALGRALGQWVSDALARLPLLEAPLTGEVAIVDDGLDMHADPADRFLAATTLVYGLTLLTVDPRLLEASWLPTRSG